MSFIYLATPYSHPLSNVREGRFRQAVCATCVIIQHKIPCYAPIVNSHPLSLDIYGEESLLTDYENWRFQDETFLRLCKELWVLQIEGWEASKGIEEEVKFANTLHIPIRFIHFLDVKEACENYLQGKLLGQVV